MLQNGTGRKTAVLGDMGELGDNAESLHREVGLFAGKCHIDSLYCIGELGRNIAEGALESVKESGSSMTVRWFPDGSAFAGNIPGMIQKGDVVLVKASRFMGFERIVRELREL